MKNTKTKIVLSLISCLMFFAFINANAANSSLYISPASAIKTAQSTFSASIELNAGGNKVCAVEGRLVFNNLTCQSISVSTDLMPQATPTCANPYFMIGIPGCTISDRTIMTLSVKSGNAGTASITSASVDIIGEGVSLGASSVGGYYTVNSVPVVTQPTTQKPVTTPTTPPVAQVQTTQTEKTITPETKTVESEPEVEIEDINSTNFEQASIAETVSGSNSYLWLGLIGLVLIIVIYGLFKLAKKE